MSRNDEASIEKKQTKSLACCYKILQMVGLLHSRGYQRLRVFLSARSMWWRCELAPAELFDPENGACMESKPEYDRLGLVARASSGDCSHPFGWTRDISRIPLQRLADIFLQSFPTIARGSNGSDWAYAGWYQEMLMRTSPFVLPIAYYKDEYKEVVCDPLRLASLVEGGEEGTMPPPPCYHLESTLSLSSNDRDKSTYKLLDNLFG